MAPNRAFELRRFRHGIRNRAIFTHIRMEQLQAAVILRRLHDDLCARVGDESPWILSSTALFANPRLKSDNRPTCIITVVRITQASSLDDVTQLSSRKRARHAMKHVQKPWHHVENKSHDNIMLLRT